MQQSSIIQLTHRNRLMISPKLLGEREEDYTWIWHSSLAGGNITDTDRSAACRETRPRVLETPTPVKNIWAAGMREWPLTRNTHWDRNMLFHTDPGCMQMLWNECKKCEDGNAWHDVPYWKHCESYLGSALYSSMEIWLIYGQIL